MSAGNPMDILLVEDFETQALLIETIIEEHNPDINVVVAASEEEAKEIIAKREQPFSHAIIDLALNGEDHSGLNAEQLKGNIDAFQGTQVAKTLVQKNDSIEIFFITASLGFHGNHESLKIVAEQLKENFPKATFETKKIQLDDYGKAFAHRIEEWLNIVC